MPVVVGGIIPPKDADTLESFGVAAVYTPKHFRLNTIMRDIVLLLDRPARGRLRLFNRRDASARLLTARGATDPCMPVPCRIALPVSRP